MLTGATCLILLLLLAACGTEPTTAAQPTAPLDPQIAAGRASYVIHCGSCHSVGEETVIVGPSLAGIATRAGARIDGLDARSYLYNSIMQPGDYLVEGYEDVMPTDFGKKLTGEEMDAIVAYLLTLQ